MANYLTSRGSSASAQKSTLSLDDDVLVLDFPYDKDLVEEIKAIAGSKWDKVGRVWRLPVSSLVTARDFAIKHDFDITNEVLAFDLPNHPNPGGGVSIEGKYLMLSFKYDPVIVRSVKQIPSVTWDAKTKAWKAPLTSIDSVVKWATTFRQHIPDYVREEADRISTSLAEIREASRSTDADVEIHRLNGSLLPYQRAGVSYASYTRRAFIADQMGLGKEQAVSTPILTPDGWVRMGDVRVGSHVIGKDGHPTRVIGVFPQGVKPMYRVSFSDGSSTLAGLDHLWTVRTALSSHRNGDWVTVKTSQILQGETYVHHNQENGRTYELSLSLKAKNGNRRLQIPMVDSVHYRGDDTPLPIDPYLLGCWLGDGSSNTGQITSMDESIHGSFAKSYQSGATIQQVNNKAKQTTYIGLRTRLRELNLLNNKHIPLQYLHSTPENRLAILQGLMDTDGTPGMYSTEFSSSNHRIVLDIVELAQSLGGIARIRTRIPTFTYKGERREGKLSYRVNIKLPENMIPFRLSRKVEKYIPPTKYPPSRYIESIEYSHDEEAQCIAVEADDHLYVTEQFIVTHNTIQAMATLEYLHQQYADDDTSPVYPAVVVCPASLVLNWKKEYNKFFPELIVETVSNRKEIPMFGTYDVIVVGYPNINAWEKQLCNHNAYIFDESHYCKSPDTQRSKSAKKMTKSNKDAVVLCLTGTPVTNRPAEYAPQLDILGQLDKFGGLWGFYRRYCNPPEAPIWMADFTHKPLGEIRVGDKIIGWDGMTGGSRRLKESVVVAVNKRQSKIVKVTLASGRIIRCTPDHLWISGKGRRWDHKKDKTKLDCFTEPKVGKSLAFAVEPIGPCPNHLVRKASWLGGVYDGEGTNQRIAQSISHNPEVYARIASALDDLGFKYSHQVDGMGINFLGGKSEFARFVAWCQPIRDKWLKERVLGPNFTRDDIVAVEEDVYGDVISLTTSTGNYFAWGYASKNCGAYRDKWGQWHLEGHSNLEELNDKLRATCYIRRTKDQVMSELPPVMHDVVTVDGTPAHMKEYKKAEADIVAYLVERAKQIAQELGLPVGAAMVTARLRAEANDHLVKMSVLRKIAAKAKMAVAEEWIEARIAEGQKVVVAAHHREIVDSLANKYGGLKIQGKMDVEEIEDAKHKFQTLPVEDAPVIVLSIQAAKTGHTLTASQNVLFLELPWTPADVDQTYSRCHRIGQKGSVTATYMLTDGTIDEQIYALIEKKRSVVGVATEGEITFDDTSAADLILQLMGV